MVSLSGTTELSLTSRPIYCSISNFARRADQCAVSKNLREKTAAIAILSAKWLSVHRSRGHIRKPPFSRKFEFRRDVNWRNHLGPAELDAGMGHTQCPALQVPKVNRTRCYDNQAGRQSRPNEIRWSFDLLALWRPQTPTRGKHRVPWPRVELPPVRAQCWSKRMKLLKFLMHWSIIPLWALIHPSKLRKSRGTGYPRILQCCCF